MDGLIALAYAKKLYNLAEGPKGDPGDVSTEQMNAAIDAAVTDVKSDIADVYDSLIENNIELFDITTATDGYYPSTNDGTLQPDASAGSSDYIRVNLMSKLRFKIGTSGTHNFIFYDKNKDFVWGMGENVSVGTYEYAIDYEAHPDICYMRVAYYLTEKSQFSVKGDYRYTRDVNEFHTAMVTPDPLTLNFAEGTTPDSWSGTSVGTFWFTHYDEMIAAYGGVIKSIKLNIETSGSTLTIRGYDDVISPTLSGDDLKAAAIVANNNAYDIFRITNATAGESTYLLDGTDSRVEIIDESLICPKTLGLFKSGDTGKFRYYNAPSLSEVAYFTHASMGYWQKKASKLGVELVTQYPIALSASIVHSNGTEDSINILPKDIRTLIGQAPEREEDSSRFLQMKMNCLGDSITYGYIPDSGAQMSKPYPSILKDILGFATVRNYGISGSTLAVNNGNYDPMCIRYANMDNDADIVLVFGGTNDYGRTVYTPSLGTITDNVNTTVYGALNILCEGLITKYPKAFIFLCTPLKRADKTGANGGGYTLEDVANAIREVGQKYGMPVLDLNYKGGFYISNATFRAQYGGNDRLHPNQTFDTEHLAPMIARFIDSNI